jgi:hypothetical protein
MSRWRALYVLVLSLELTFLAAVIALGKVSKDTSYGLEIVLMALGGALAAVLVIKESSTP